MLPDPKIIAVLGWDVVQTQIPAVNFVQKYEHVFAFKYGNLLESLLGLTISQSNLYVPDTAHCKAMRLC